MQSTMPSARFSPLPCRTLNDDWARPSRSTSTKDYSLPKSAPLVSIVVPLYKVLDFLRFQLSGMATDPWLAANAEVIYVLDSPEIQDETEHLLGGLHLLHGLPMKLVVMNRNGGYARACNAGARFARGSILVMLNSDVVPCEPGWLQILVAGAAGRQDAGRRRPETDLRRRIAAACRALFRPRPARDLAEPPFPQGHAWRLRAGAADPRRTLASPAPAW